ncbi:MAG TPA: CHAP domain-containing protein [Candidatus Saccharimonadales bacterium]|nr:CHAP domain-containing protein [Candidatus Saccharimonadales bacterium]
MSPIRALTIFLSVVVIAQLIVSNSAVRALNQNALLNLGTSSIYWWPDQGGVCATASTLSSPNTSEGTNQPPSATTAPTNKDYAGRQILTDAQLTAIQQSQSVYQQAASQVGIPWQMIAVVHLRESGLKVANPANGQGIFQFANKQGGPYPEGPVSQAEFLRQAILAAQYLKTKATANYAAHKTLSTNSDGETVKDTFFSYNGRAGSYINQAAALGFDPNSQGYEGSPYVMNKADAKRDPATNPSGWGQIKTDGGSLSYPANGDYGAFIEYGALTGIQSDNCGGGTVNCSSTTNAAATSGISPTRQKVVCLLEQELQLWKNGQMKIGFRANSADSFSKYSQNANELWCADFVSWIYNQAGYPLKDGGAWRIPGVATIDSIGRAGGKFHWHAPGGYTPRPGDLVIHGGSQHVNAVDTYTNGKLTMIGGDQGNPAYKGNPDNEYPDYSIVSADTYEINDITAYVSPD